MSQLCLGLSHPFLQCRDLVCARLQPHGLKTPHAVPSGVDDRVADNTSNRDGGARHRGACGILHNYGQMVVYARMNRIIPPASR